MLDQLEEQSQTQEVPSGTGSTRLAARLVLGIGLALVSVAIDTLAAPPHAWWPLAFISLVPMLVAQHRVLPRPAAGLALGVTVGGSTLAASLQQFERPPGALVALGLGLGVVLVGLGWMDRALQERSAYRYFPLAVPLIWVGLDFTSGHSSVLSTWGYAAYAFYAHPVAIQPVSITTTDGLNLLILVANFTLASFLVGPSRSRRRIWLGAVALVWAVWIGLGAALVGSGGTRVRVAAVQMTRSASVVDFSSSGAVEASSPALVAMNRAAAAAARQGARLVVFHEGLLVLDPATASAESTEPIARANEVYLVAGFYQPDRNQAEAVSPSGRVLGLYDKQHPVTFMGEHSVSSPVPVYPTRIGRLATIICYDLDFLDTSREAGRRGAQIVAVPSQDWGQIAGVHYTHLVFPAVENHLAMVKADGGFDSAIIDPYGRIKAHSVDPAGRNALLVAEVPLGTGRSVAQDVEPWFAPAALAAGLLLFVLMMAQPARRESG